MARLTALCCVGTAHRSTRVHACGAITKLLGTMLAAASVVFSCAEGSGTLEVGTLADLRAANKGGQDPDGKPWPKTRVEADLVMA